jgi:signal transduction histidine kinase
VTPQVPLRTRLAVVGLVSVLAPLLVLLGVAAWTTEETRTTPGGTTVTKTGDLSPWIPATVAVLVVPSAIAAWWWAGREIVLHERTARAIDHERRLIEDASHQLRTPIAVLVTNADVTLAEPDPTIDGLRSAIEQSRQTATDMQATVESLLHQARGRRDDANRQATDLVAIAETVVQRHAHHAATAGVTIRQTAPERLDVPTDAQALERALDAVIDNAIRHSPAGGVIHVDITSSMPTATISITDDGPGIPAVHHTDVFSRSWTTDPSRNGIGLAIVAEAARNAFDVDLESPTSPSGGCRLTFRLPRRRPLGPTPR